MSNQKQYWKGLEQLTNDPEFVKNADKEFPALSQESEDSGSSRRDFLKMMGFSVAAVSLAACEAPVRKAIPYLNKPVDVDPGIPNYYASSYISGGDYCSIVVKTREGRPIKIDGNNLSPITQGKTSAEVEASVLSLYDDSRLRGPKAGGTSVTWEDLDKQVGGKLDEIAAKGGAIRIVSNSIISPSTKAAVAQFKAKYPTTEHVAYDPISAAGILKANEESFGQAAIPAYDFSKADVIVSIGADFLANWISPVEHSLQYAKTRKLGDKKKTMSRHFQFESNLSLTGSNADYRTPIKPSQEGLVVALLYNQVALATNAGSTVTANIGEVPYINEAAKELAANAGKSIVVSGSNDKDVQVLVNGINHMLRNYDKTIDLGAASNTRQGDDVSMEKFIADAEGGRVGAVIFYNANPIYDHPKGEALKAALGKIELSVSTSYKEDETAANCSHLAPDNHFLESWNDAEPRKGHYSLAQPAITPVFKTRQAQETFLLWGGAANTDYFEFIKENWKPLFDAQNEIVDFQYFWDKCLYDGVYASNGGQISTASDATAIADNVDAPTSGFQGDVNAAASAIGRNYKAENTGLELAIYQKAGLGSGTQSNNPLLQELPDPITKVTWDNYVTISQKDASDMGIKMGESSTQLVSLTANGVTVKAPALIQPGQAVGTIGLSVGYGRTNAGKVADGIGTNAYPFVTKLNGTLSYNVTSDVSISATGEPYQLARTQTHQTYMGRETVIQESTLSEYKKDPSAGRYQPKISTWQDEEGKVKPGEISLWHGHEYKSHHWGLTIDLTSCTGCSACVVACHVENNVPAVGKEEVINRRDMHWMRIDRYYSSDAPADDLEGLEKAAANPEVTFQPMMCQHCNNAPCETVCPVAATTHSSEGLNQMTYNRCIGTRYCANNCPYKVRRFNWFKYHDNEQFAQSNPQMNTDLGKMVLNPDVTVRSRGVMEKCSLCVQRIQYGKLEAKKEKRPVKDGEIVTACAAACTTGAIVFGDMNDEESRISKLLKIKTKKEDNYKVDNKYVAEPRAYNVLEEIGVKPNVFYLTKIRNKDKVEA
ncbi:MAG: TAT-variant-translocated molybdopterin oxidoreductase [Bacteroidota bacterium]